jgi:ABC-type phosphate transport system auxiliary subunit
VPDLQAKIVELEELSKEQETLVQQAQGSSSSRVEALELELARAQQAMEARGSEMTRLESLIEAHEVKHAELEGQLEAVKVWDSLCLNSTVLLDADCSGATGARAAARPVSRLGRWSL